MRLLSSLLTSLLPLTSLAAHLTLTVPSHLPALPCSSRAILHTNGTTLSAPVTRANTFVFASIPSPAVPSQEKTQWLLDIACRDYDFASYGLEVGKEGKMEIYRVVRGMEVPGERLRLGDGNRGEAVVEVRVLRGREYYDARAGFSPLSLLKNPMVLIGVVGLAFVMGMPYLMENMDPEMRQEFEEHSKKSVLPGGGGAHNPLQNFDMAAWMAGKTSGSSGRDVGEGSSGVSRRRG